MRWSALAGLGLSGVVAGMALTGPGVGAAEAVLLRHHFAGLSAVATRSDLTPVAALLRLPASVRLKGEVDRKLALRLPGWFGAEVGAATNHVKQLRAWVRTVLDRESYLEVLGAEGRVGSWAVAVRMEEAAALEVGRGLRAGLAPFFGEEAGEEASGEWVVAGKDGRRDPAVRFVYARGWAVVGSGGEACEGMLRRIRADGTPTSEAGVAVSKLEADLAGLAAVLGWPAEPVGPEAQWPAVRAMVEPRQGRLRTTAELRYARPLGLSLEPWTVPASVLRDPLVGFTAMQGADRWLGRLELFKPYEVGEWPRQFYFWSIAGDPWNQYIAGPMASPTNLMAKLSLPLPMRMVTNMSWRGQVFGLRVTNQATRVEFRGLPYLLPFLESVKEGEEPMLFGGLFPLAAKGSPAPAELLEQVSGRTNLVLYDWETTGRDVVWTNAPGAPGPRVTTNAVGRLTQFKQLNQYWRLMMNTQTNRVPLTPGGEIWTPGWDWVNAAQGRLGDTVTEVSQEGPEALKLVRVSQLGFNALELAYLLRWVENPGFPGWSDEVYLPAGAKTVPAPQAPVGEAKP